MENFWLIGVDIGGTFTDAVSISAADLRLAKVLSNPTDPGQAVLAALDALNIETPPDRLLHSTTLVTNMLLERKGAPTAFITSAGFRDLLHIGRHKRPLNYAIRQEISAQHHPPVPRQWRLTVPERVSAEGQIIIPLDEAAVRTVAQQLVAAGVEAVAIGFLHSYRFADHEQQARRWVEESAPDLFVCTSSRRHGSNGDRCRRCHPAAPGSGAARRPTPDPAGFGPDCLQDHLRRDRRRHHRRRVRCVSPGRSANRLCDSGTHGRTRLEPTRAGPLLACGVAHTLALAEVIVPPHPGLLAAWGLLAAPNRHEAVVTVLRLLDDLFSAQLAELRNRATAGLSQPPPPEAMLRHLCALRYLGQGFEVEVPLEPDDTPETLTERFHAVPQHEYGFALPRAAVEWVELRAAWEIAPRAWHFPPPAGPSGRATPTSLWERDAQTGQPARRQARVWLRQDLPPATTLDGPAVILEQDTTICIPTGWQARVEQGGYLRLTR